MFGWESAGESLYLDSDWVNDDPVLACDEELSYWTD
jgi:hypothetical protein